MNTIAIIGSSGGSAIQATQSCLEKAGFSFSPIIITDRSCGLSEWAIDKGLIHYEISYTSPEQFSTDVNELLQKKKIQHVLLFYTRLIAEPLISQLQVHNIHPSILPAFPGMDAVTQSLKAGSKLLGATLHQVDKNLDTGSITTQVACSFSTDITIQLAHRISFIQKVWLALIYYENTENFTVNEQEKKQSNNYLPIEPAIQTSSQLIKNKHILNAYRIWIEMLEPIEEE